MPVVIKHNTTGRYIKCLEWPELTWVDKVDDADVFHNSNVAEYIMCSMRLNAQLEHVAIGG